MKSLGFTWKNSKFTGILHKAFDPHISPTVPFVIHGVAKLIFVSVVVEADDLLAPTL